MSESLLVTERPEPVARRDDAPQPIEAAPGGPGVPLPPAGALQPSESGEGSGHGEQENFLSREAAEVYLLLDYLSGRTDKSLRPTEQERVQRLLQGSAVQGSGTQGETAPCAEIEADLSDPCRLLMRVLRIKFPVRYDPQNFEANGAFLLRARDILNGRAAPASGASIAFTTLAAGARGRFGGRSGSWNRRREHDEGDGSKDLRFAEIAYPKFKREARRLSWRIAEFRWLALIVLLIALALSAYTAWGKSILDSMDAIRRDAKAVDEQIAAVVKTAPPKPCAADGSSVLCAKADINQRFEVATHHLASWAAPLRGVCIPPVEGTVGAASAGCPPLQAGAALDEARLFAVEQKRTIEWATALLAVMGNYILPSIYGMLGALAFVLRRYNDRLASSLLTDRDRSVNNIRLVLGTAIGASIGLLYTGAGMAQLSGMLGQAVTLSMSSIAFFAGYGVEAVFKMIDAFITHVFRVGAEQNSPSRPG